MNTIEAKEVVIKEKHKKYGQRCFSLIPRKKQRPGPREQGEKFLRLY